jgi:hypothetical protein
MVNGFDDSVIPGNKKLNKSFWKSRKPTAWANIKPLRGTRHKNASLNKSFWKSRNLFSKRFLAAGGKKRIIS